MSETVLNFDDFEPRVQQAILFSLYEGLKAGESFDILNSKDLAQIYDELSRLNMSAMKFEFVERGPSTWHIRISKLIKDQTEQAHSCCGICGGH